MRFRARRYSFDFGDLASLCGMMLGDTGFSTELVDGVCHYDIDEILFFVGELDPMGVPEEPGLEYIIDDNGKIVQRNAVFRFDRFDLYGDDIRATADRLVIEMSSVIDSGFHENPAVSAFSRWLAGDVAEAIVVYVREEGEIRFDIADYPPRYGSGREPSDPDPDHYDGQAVKRALNEQCFDAVREQVETIVRDSFGGFIANLEVVDETDTVADI